MTSNQTLVTYENIRVQRWHKTFKLLTFDRSYKFYNRITDLLAVHNMQL